MIVLRGAGRSFCAGYDFAGGFHHWDESLTTDGRWDPGKDFALAASPYGPTQRFMSMWRTPKPVIAQVHGWCVGGGSDMALCADLIIASEDAQIGTPYSRVWGCYLSGMWLYRLGLTKAKEHALTGKPLSGREAADVELINAAVPFEDLEQPSPSRPAAREHPVLPAGRDEAVVNQAYESMGLHATQTLGPILDGLMRNTPDGLGFVETPEAAGVRAATSSATRRSATTARPARTAGRTPPRDHPLSSASTSAAVGSDGWAPGREAASAPAAHARASAAPRSRPSSSETTSAAQKASPAAVPSTAVTDGGRARATSLPFSSSTAPSAPSVSATSEPPGSIRSYS